MSELLIHRAEHFRDCIALISEGISYTYGQLLEHSRAVASALIRENCIAADVRVALLVRANAAYIFAQWGVWKAGHIVLPLCPDHPLVEMQFLLSDSGTRILVAERYFADRVSELVKHNPVRVIWLEDAIHSGGIERLPGVTAGMNAMMLYTSGTTSRPKGVVTTHGNIAAQITALTTAWEWSAADRIANFLPLHHIHGVINIISCALWSGATCELYERFDLKTIFSRVESGELTLFMAVPTIYAKLIEAFNGADPARRQRIARGFRMMRLMVSGSAALPIRILEQWREITGHTLLERYGMTETGMILSNPLHGTRIAGSVGLPLPGVDVRLVTSSGVLLEESVPGEIQVRGPGVFGGYWNRPAVNAESFIDGWFRTGDVATCVDGTYRILGRQSIDIIKTGGYKVSAIEIEETLRDHPDIAQCAVIGLADEEWGQRVAAVVILNPARTMCLADLREWSKERMSAYKAPSLLVVVDQFPLNAMGKVIKHELIKLVAAVRG